MEDTDDIEMQEREMQMETSNSEETETEVAVASPSDKQEQKTEKQQPRFHEVIEISERKQNPLLDREVVVLVVKANRNPSNEEAKKLIAKELKVNEEMIAIKTIGSTYGLNQFDIVAHVYNNKNSMERLEFVKKEKAAEQPADE